MKAVKYLAGISIMILIGCSKPTSIWFSGNLEEAQQLAQTSQKMVLIDFFSPT